MDILEVVVTESGVSYAFCVPPAAWPREVVDELNTVGKDLKDVLAELGKEHAFAYQWGSDYLLLSPFPEFLIRFRSELESHAGAPIEIGSGTREVEPEDYLPGMNARVFSITDDTGMGPTETFRRLEVIRGVAEFLKILLYENCENDPDNPQRQILYPESRDEEMRDPRYMGTIVVIDTEENLQKVKAFLDSANQQVRQFKLDYWKWATSPESNPNMRPNSGR